MCTLPPAFAFGCVVPDFQRLDGLQLQLQCNGQSGNDISRKADKASAAGVEAESSWVGQIF